MGDLFVIFVMLHQSCAITGLTLSLPPQGLSEGSFRSLSVKGKWRDLYKACLSLLPFSRPPQKAYTKFEYLPYTGYLLEDEYHRDIEFSCAFFPFPFNSGNKPYAHRVFQISLISSCQTISYVTVNG